MRNVHLYRHPVFLIHDPGPGHPESSDRLRAIDAGIRERGLEEGLVSLTPEKVDIANLYRVHHRNHVDRILALEGQSALLDADTAVSPGSVEAALLASGAAVEATGRVLEDPSAVAFCLGRPPGHHATKDRAMGFCLFNHIAVAAAWAISERKLERVMIFDPDVHHGNGTQAIFYDRSDVFYLSMHQYPFYPGTGAAGETGEGEGKGYTVNMPLPAGAGDEEYLDLTNRTVLPLLETYRPELFLVSAGFDAHEWDPLGEMNLTTQGFLTMYGKIFAVLMERRVPVVFILEGGYSLDALRDCVPALLETLVSHDL